MNQRVRVVVLLFLVVGLVAAVAVLSRPSTSDVAVPAPRDPALPDLVSLPLADFLIGTSEATGVQELRFTSSIGNVGAGPLHVDARRANGSDEDWQVIQWFTEPDGEPSGVVTGADMVFGGHGHEHWHLKFGASYRLYPRDGDEVASQTKAGFCFFDQVRLEPEIAGSPDERAFGAETCGQRGWTAVEMGMSVGWSDPYFWSLEDQAVVVTGLPDGPYRLTAEADPDGWLMESDETNNGTWTDLSIGTTPDGLRTVEVVASAGQE